jgi:hypothetical protein
MSRDVPNVLKHQINTYQYVLNIYAGYSKRIRRIITKSKLVRSKIFQIRILTFQCVALDVHYVFICEWFKKHILSVP